MYRKRILRIVSVSVLSAMFLNMAGVVYAADGGIIVGGTTKLSETTNFPTGFDSELEASDNFGASIGGYYTSLDAGGVEDMVVGASGDDDDNTNAGAVYVFFMQTDNTAASYQKISDTTGTPVGFDLSDQDKFGSGVNTTLDINDDGVQDLLVGAQGDDDGGNAFGAVYVLFMNTDGTVDDFSKISDSNGITFPASQGNPYFGSAVDNTWDIDSDGVADMVVGASGLDGDDINDGGVKIVLLDSDGTVKEEKAWITEDDLGEEFDGDAFGFGVAGMKDVDGDTYMDIAVGAPYYPGGGTARGAVFIIFLNSDGSYKGHQTITSGTTDFKTLDDNERFGSDIELIMDVNNDGIRDMVVGAYRNDGGASNGHGGMYTIFLDTDGSVKGYEEIDSGATNFVTLDASDEFAKGLGYIGDLNGDNLPDMVGGAWKDDDGDGSNSGAVYVMNLDGTDAGGGYGTETGNPPAGAGVPEFSDYMYMLTMGVCIYMLFGYGVKLQPKGMRLK
jgi:hypothetical protein